MEDFVSTLVSGIILVAVILFNIRASSVRKGKAGPAVGCKFVILNAKNFFEDTAFISAMAKLTGLSGNSVRNMISDNGKIAFLCADKREAKTKIRILREKGYYGNMIIDTKNEVHIAVIKASSQQKDKEKKIIKKSAETEIKGDVSVKAGKEKCKESAVSGKKKEFDLRMGIIYKEILDKPLALRNSDAS